MDLKWQVYLVAFFSYSTIHAIRTMWITISNYLAVPPFNYQVPLVGTIDMIQLFVLASFMSLAGPKIEAWGVKATLITALILLSILTMTIGFFLSTGQTEIRIYILLFGIGVGLVSCVGWPCCLCMISYYFGPKNGISLSVYNSTSFFGDFTALLTYYAVVKLCNKLPGSAFYMLSLYLIGSTLLAAIFFPNKLRKPEKKENCLKQIQLDHLSSLQKPKGEQKQKKSYIDYELFGKHLAKRIKLYDQPDWVIEQLEQIEGDMITVWLLPGVALNVLAYGFIKAVNSLMIRWLIYHLSELESAVIITALWSISVFSGGIVSATFNKNYSKSIFLIQLLLALVCFIFLDDFQNKMHEGRAIFFLVVGGFFYGGPYNLMSTAIPLVLGTQKQAEHISNGQIAIISLIEGYGQFFCGFSLLLSTLFQIESINAIGALYCCCGFLLFGWQWLRQRHLKKEKQKEVSDCNKELLANNF